MAKTKDIGRSGLSVVSGEVDNEYLNELQGVNGQIMYHKMLTNDDQIAKICHAVNNPIKSANWDIQPASDDEKDVKIAELVKHILFDDIPNGWQAKLDEILTYPWTGVAVFEKTFANKKDKKFGNYTGLFSLGYRDTRTIDKWNYNTLGELESIHQKQSGDIAVDATIPATDLIMFFNERKGNDLGLPFLRQIYGNYKRRQIYKKLQAIGIERTAIGVPIVHVPASIDTESQDYKSMETQLAAYTQAESAYIIVPEGYDIELNNNTGFNPSLIQTAIKAENEGMSSSLVGMWLEMGIDGNSAVGSSTTIAASFFVKVIEYLATKICVTINNDLIKDLVQLNFGEVDNYPTLVCSNIDKAGLEWTTILSGLTNAGIITVDDELEDFVRDVYKLPKRTTSREEQETVKKEETVEGPKEVKEKSSEPISDKQEASIEENKNLSEYSLDEEKKHNPSQLMEERAAVTARAMEKIVNASKEKYIHDVINRFKELPELKKQKATDSTVISGRSNLEKTLKEYFIESCRQALKMAIKEVGNENVPVNLTDKQKQVLQLSEEEIVNLKGVNRNDLPVYVQLLSSKQARLISTATIAGLKSTIDFAYSSAATEKIEVSELKKDLEMQANKEVEPFKMLRKALDATALLINTTRQEYFEIDDSAELIHSYTFMNEDPKSPICRQLTGKTFATDDDGSLMYAPPLHHNCKSWLRPNLKTSKGVENLKITKLNPSSAAQKSITL